MKNLPVHQTIIEPKKGWQVIDWKELREYKDLLYFLVMRDIKILYKQTVLGFAWAIIRPVFSMIIFSVVFGRLAKVPSDGIPYPVFSYVALIPWTYFQNSLTKATDSLITGKEIFTKVYYPRIFIPLTPILASLLDFLISFIILLGMMFFYGISLNINLLFLPILVFLVILTSAGIGTWLSALAIQYRDIKHAIQFLSQLLMYAAPVVWPASLIAQKFGHTAQLIYAIYPMVGVIEGFRAALLGKTPMPWQLIGIGAGTALCIFLSGILYFKRKEKIFADVA